MDVVRTRRGRGEGGGGSGVQPVADEVARRAALLEERVERAPPTADFTIMMETEGHRNEKVTKQSYRSQ